MGGPHYTKTTFFWRTIVISLLGHSPDREESLLRILSHKIRQAEEETSHQSLSKMLTRPWVTADAVVLQVAALSALTVLLLNSPVLLPLLSSPSCLPSFPPCIAGYVKPGFGHFQASEKGGPGGFRRPRLNFPCRHQTWCCVCAEQWKKYEEKEPSHH